MTVRSPGAPFPETCWTGPDEPCKPLAFPLEGTLVNSPIPCLDACLVETESTVLKVDATVVKVVPHFLPASGVSGGPNVPDAGKRPYLLVLPAHDPVVGTMVFTPCCDETCLTRNEVKVL